MASLGCQVEILAGCVAQREVGCSLMSRASDLRFWIEIKLREYEYSQSDHYHAHTNEGFLEHCMEILPQQALTCPSESAGRVSRLSK